MDVKEASSTKEDSCPQMMMTKMCMFGWDVKTLLGVMPHAER
jgi:hypothetical protein